MRKKFPTIYGKLFHIRGKNFPTLDVERYCCGNLLTYGLEFTKDCGMFVAV
jgi:hypothetical protein